MPHLVQSITSNNSGRLGAIPNVSFIPNPTREFGLNSYDLDLAQLDSVTPITMPPITPIVLNIPRMFGEVIPDEDQVDNIFRSLFEQHALSINGIDINKTLETEQRAIGYDGQQISIPLHSRLAQVNPSFSWNELIGNPIFNFISLWIELIRDHNTQRTGIVSTTGRIAPQVYSDFSMDMLFIQHDNTYHHDNIINAFVITQMFPQGTNDGGFLRNQSGENTSPQRDITFNGIIQENLQTRRLGRTVSEALNLHNSEFNNRTIQSGSYVPGASTTRVIPRTDGPPGS